MSIGLCDDSNSRDPDWNDLSQFDTSEKQFDSPEMREANARVVLTEAIRRNFFDDAGNVIVDFVIQSCDGSLNFVEKGSTFDTEFKVLIQSFKAEEIGTMSVHADETSAEISIRKVRQYSRKENAPLAKNSFAEESAFIDSDFDSQTITICTMNEIEILLSEPSFTASMQSETSDRQEEKVFVTTGSHSSEQ